jgi:NADPH:quinone reductase-like Zn-dependent oxidoreductase
MKVMELRTGWGLDHLLAAERADPQPGENEVVVEMRAASINYRDVVMVRGGYGSKGGQLPLIPVSDGAGVIVATGARVSRVKVGDLVCPNFAQTWIDGPFRDDLWTGMLGGYRDGVLQQFMLLPEDGVVKVPSHMDATAAATLPCAALTAWSAIIDCGVKPGSVVLTQGTGGVSIFALQFAKLCGAHVIVTSSSDEKLQRAKQFGADEIINYRTDASWEKRARQIAGPNGIDLVVDLAGTLDQSVKAVKAGGTVAVIGVLASATSSLSLGQVVTRAVRLQGVTAGSLRAFEAMMRAIELHRLEPAFDVVCRRMDQAATAIAAVTEGTHFGKICMELAA